MGNATLNDVSGSEDQGGMEAEKEVENEVEKEGIVVEVVGRKVENEGLERAIVVGNGLFKICGDEEMDPRPEEVLVVGRVEVGN